MTDKDWVDYGKETTDEELTLYYREYFGMEVECPVTEIR
jgi:hypothetical protein